MKSYIFPPLNILFFIIFILLFCLTFLLIPVTFQIVFGLDEITALLVFFFIILGSLVNIPLYEKPSRQSEQIKIFYFYFYFVRVKKIVIAVNLGGCIFPSILAIKALVDSIDFVDPFHFFLSLSFATLLSYLFAKPVRGVGIVIPLFIPVLVSLASSLICIHLSSAPISLLPKLSFSIGVLSTIIGADILHLSDFEKVGEGVVSIGGAGTFDGIFLTGIFAAILASIIV